MRVRPYILAGGKSSRMGRDKAMLEVDGETLLARMIHTVRSVSGLGEAAMTVTVVGQRASLEGADRLVVDRYPECGPLGGIEAALHDLPQNDGGDWALFLPVDMPMLRADLIGSVLAEWRSAIEGGSSVRCGMLAVKGRLQPLVSLVHCTMHEPVRNSLRAGVYKVAQVLGSDENSVYMVDVQALELARLPELSVQFNNVNTEADLMEVKRLLHREGRSEHPSNG